MVKYHLTSLLLSIAYGYVSEVINVKGKQEGRSEVINVKGKQEGRSEVINIKLKAYPLRSGTCLFKYIFLLPNAL